MTYALLLTLLILSIMAFAVITIIKARSPVALAPPTLKPAITATRHNYYIISYLSFVATMLFMHGSQYLQALKIWLIPHSKWDVNTLI